METFCSVLQLLPPQTGNPKNINCIGSGPVGPVVPVVAADHKLCDVGFHITSQMVYLELRKLEEKVSQR